jgi:hypothetical protein
MELITQGKRDMKTACKFILFLILSTSISIAREHVIYSVEEEVPMGEENEIQKKNYYINMGNNQGLKNGTILEVFRIISKANPYDNLKRINYKVKIGELKVLHSDDEAAIGSSQSVRLSINDPLFEVRNFMIGDHVSVKVKD